MFDLCRFLSVKFPVIQGGMAKIATAEFAAVMSEAGALGLIASGGITGGEFRSEIRKARKLTDKPFGVNLLMMHPEIDELAKIAVGEGVSVITTGAGNPARYMPEWLANGIKVIPVIPSVALARRMEALGASAVIAEGTEAGGHVGELTTMALVPQVVNAVKIPVIAAGGIAEGSQLLAAFALGACGVQMGTALLAASECPIHENYKNALIKAGDTDTVVTGRIGGVPVRVLKNAMTREYLKKERAGASRDELEHFTLNALSKAVIEGDTVNGSIMAGQVAGQLREIRPAAEILETLFAQLEASLRKMRELPFN